MKAYPVLTAQSIHTFQRWSLHTSLSQLSRHRVTSHSRLSGDGVVCLCPPAHTGTTHIILSSFRLIGEGRDMLEQSAHIGSQLPC